jgi:dephospho-CoA kinase
MTIGVTGGMGCGKSTAARQFEAKGCRLIDSDELIRTQILTAPEVIATAREWWGEDVVQADGQLNRSAVARRIFTDDDQLSAWEAEIHPRLYDRWRELLKSDPAAPWVIEVPLLFEQRLENWFDFIVCVASSPDVQLARLSERGIPHALAGQRISKQMALDRKLELADVVLWNDGSAEFLEQQVDQVLVQLNLPVTQS